MSSFCFNQTIRFDYVKKILRATKKKTDFGGVFTMKIIVNIPETIIQQSIQSLLSSLPSTRQLSDNNWLWFYTQSMAHRIQETYFFMVNTGFLVLCTNDRWSQWTLARLEERNERGTKHPTTTRGFEIHIRLTLWNSVLRVDNRLEIKWVINDANACVCMRLHTSLCRRERDFLRPQYGTSYIHLLIYWHFSLTLPRHR